MRASILLLALAQAGAYGLQLRKDVVLGPFWKLSGKAWSPAQLRDTADKAALGSLTT